LAHNYLEARAIYSRGSNASDTCFQARKQLWDTRGAKSFLRGAQSLWTMPKTISNTFFLGGRNILQGGYGLRACLFF